MSLFLALGLIALTLVVAYQVNKKQIERMVSLCGASLPPKFTKVMSRYEHNPQALRDAGIAYAIDQIVDLVSNNVQGLHLYTMNRPQIATEIMRRCDAILREFRDAH